MRLIGLLDDRADKAGEVGQVAGQESLAKLDIGNEASERIRSLVVGRRGEQRRGHRLPMRDRRQRQIFLALEVMKEASLRQPRLGADVLDPGRAIAFGAHDPQRRVEELDLGFVLKLHGCANLSVSIPTAGYGRQAACGVNLELSARAPPRARP